MIHLSRLFPRVLDIAQKLVAVFWSVFLWTNEHSITHGQQNWPLGECQLEARAQPLQYLRVMQRGLLPGGNQGTIGAATPALATLCCQIVGDAINAIESWHAGIANDILL